MEQVAHTQFIPLQITVHREKDGVPEAEVAGINRKCLRLQESEDQYLIFGLLVIAFTTGLELLPFPLCKVWQMSLNCIPFTPGLTVNTQSRQGTQRQTWKASICFEPQLHDEGLPLPLSLLFSQVSIPKVLASNTSLCTCF
jgi:hypothetical protein